MMTNEIINKDWLESMASTKKEFLKKLFTVFLRDEPARVVKIREALQGGKMDDLKYLAHSLKGAAATMGADKVRDACLHLEHSALDGDTEQAYKDMLVIEDEMKSVYDFMAEFIQ
ncbi:HPt (histidine-containing phosphotransfer) domain-containing protein [Desulfovibrio gilichinskyi]|uniref:HPt (Histidine-containing phosphotransfer) domain-containing protein n=2 Tax=Desulfovibrio gilichinskyi TaxID=1519643 RepID=A0A1X7CF80_9BACT|nr:HPt (histidine-containing phosphotransfer) domain-containing protein [Desulfovibrio gilichinskyi]